MIKIKKTIILLALAAILLCSLAYAQLIIPDAEKGKTTCGNKIREGHEMCEPKTDDDLCEQAGKILGIVMACSPKDCTCVPVRMDCGNQIREGTEFCDPGEKETPEENDFCGKLGAVFNETFTCENKTCMCKPEQAYGVIKSVCGDGNVTGSEECENNTSCRTDQICTNCTCTIKERDISEIKQELENETSETEPAPAKKEEKKKEGFDYHDLVGVAIPEELKGDFKEAKVNIHVMLDAKNGSIIGVVTSHGVIQEFVDNGMKSPSFDVYVKKSKADEITNSENRTKSLLKAFEDGEIKYKPRGFFNRIIFWFKNLFK